jgi:branched-chain amino acid transport system substrate-binding protein
MKFLALLLFLSGLAMSTHANETVDPEKIVIGQSVELSGEATGKENMEGALAYFNWINARGGVYGRRIELKTYDDKRNPEDTKKNTEKLINEDHAFALFGYRSTPTIEATLPLLTQYEIPMIAPFSGAQSLHHPFNRYLFNLRASYQDEAAKMVETLATLKYAKVGILYQDDPFGKDGLQGFEGSLTSHNLKAAFTAKYDRKDMNIDAAVEETVAANPQAMLMSCTPLACSEFVKRVHKRGSYPIFMMLSNVSSEIFFQSIGHDGGSVAVMQVMPNPHAFDATVTQNFQHVLKEMASPPHSTYSTLEGFVAAKLLVEGLQAAGPNLTRKKLIAALEKMHNYDLGGVNVSYSTTNHDGSRFVEIVMVDKAGQIER